jgi:hypothetical protein
MEQKKKQLAMRYVSIHSHSYSCFNNMCNHNRLQRRQDRQKDSQSSSAQSISTAEDSKEVSSVDDESNQYAALELAFAKVKKLAQDKNLTPDQIDHWLNLSFEESLKEKQQQLQYSQANVASSSRTESRRDSFAVESSQIDKEQLQNEARKIADTFAQEQQKHDLMMKIQQARQRQTLQRKLWERNMARQQQQQQLQLRSSRDEFEEEDGDGDDDEDDENDQSHEVESISIRGKSSVNNWVKDAKAAQQAQQAVRGLSLPPGNLIAKADPKAMAMRGMNLAPMMLRK